MRRALSLSLLAGLAALLAGCPELLEPQATVTSGQNAPTIDQAQAIPYNGPRARIAVITFDNKTGKGYGRIGQGMADMLATEFVNTNRYIVLERQELGAVTAEQDLARSGRIQPGTGAPTGQIEGAELLVMGALTAFEPDYQGGGIGIGGGRIHHRRGSFGGLGLGLKQSYVAIDLRVVDARTSRIVAATTVEGRASDIGGMIGAGGFGRHSVLGVGLGAFRNTPMEKAVRVCLAQAVQFVISKTPANYYHFNAAGQPVGAQPVAPPPPPVQPVAPPPPVQPQPVQPQPVQPQPVQPAPPAGGQLPAQVYVKAGAVKVYQQAQFTAAAIATVTRGTALRVQAQQGDWYGVQLPDGKLGWIMKNFVQTQPVQ